MTRALEQFFREGKNAVPVSIEETARVQASRYNYGRIALDEGVVSRRGSCEEPEGREGDWPRGRHDGLDGRDRVQNHRYDDRRGDFDGDVSRDAERAVGVGDVVVCVDVDGLNGAAGDGQRDADECDKGPPET